MTVPVYVHSLSGKTRYTIAFYRDGRRRRRCFTDLGKAKQEAKIIAEKIVRGMQAQNDLKPVEREAYLAAQRMLEEAGVPLTVAAEDYAQCRKLLGDIPLRSAIEDFLHRTRGVKLGVTVPQIVEELIAAKKQDGVSDHYMDQLHSILGIFSRAFTGPIMDVKSEEIDAWLRSKKIAPINQRMERRCRFVLLLAPSTQSVMPLEKWMDCHDPATTWSLQTCSTDRSYPTFSPTSFRASHSYRSSSRWLTRERAFEAGIALGCSDDRRSFPEKRESKSDSSVR